MINQLCSYKQTVLLSLSSTIRQIASVPVIIFGIDGDMEINVDDIVLVYDEKVPQ